jgi:hypothetical protein
VSLGCEEGAHALYGRTGAPLAAESPAVPRSAEQTTRIYARGSVSEPEQVQLPDLKDAPGELLLTPKQLAALMSTSTDCLERMAAKGEGPPVLKLGPRTHRYQWGLFREWLQYENLKALGSDRVLQTIRKEEHVHD